MTFSGSFEQGILKLRVPWAYIKVKVKQSHYRPGQAQRVPGS